MVDFQALVDGMAAGWQRERSETQLTLGGLIDALEAMPADAVVANLCEPDSYRGYYCDLYFEHQDGTRPAADLLADCREAMGQKFEGYKGGDYWMNAATPLWIASYGCCGEKLMAVLPGGAIETREDDHS